MRGKVLDTLVEHTCWAASYAVEADHVVPWCEREDEVANDCRARPDEVREEQVSFSGGLALEKDR